MWSTFTIYIRQLWGVVRNLPVDPCLLRAVKKYWCVYVCVSLGPHAGHTLFKVERSFRTDVTHTHVTCTLK